MDAERVRDVVLGQHAAAAEADARRHGYRRAAVAQIRNALLGAALERQAVVLDGPRRTGKSVALRQLAHELRPDEAPYVSYCDCTDIRLRGIGVQALVSALAGEVGSGPSGARFVLLDEIHYTGEHWARELKFAVDNVRYARIAVADSAVALVQSSLQQELAGRYTSVQMQPLDFAEWRSLRRYIGVPVAEATDGPGLTRECRQYLQLGGFPAHVERRGEARAVHEHLRQQVVAQAVRDDIRPLRGLRDVDNLERLFVARIASSGTLLNVEEARRLAGISAPTARDWLQAIVDTKLLWELWPWSRSSGRHERSRPKLYAVDPGLVEACSIPVFGPASGATDTQLLGRQLETAVAQALRVYANRRHARLSFLRRPEATRNGAEVDFIVEEDDGRAHAVECTVQRDAQKVGPLGRLLREEKVGVASTIVVSLRTEREVVKADGSTVQLVPMHELLLQLADPNVEMWPWA